MISQTKQKVSVVQYVYNIHPPLIIFIVSFCRFLYLLLKSRSINMIIIEDLQHFLTIQLPLLMIEKKTFFFIYEQPYSHFDLKSKCLDILLTQLIFDVIG